VAGTLFLTERTKMQVSKISAVSFQRGGRAVNAQPWEQGRPLTAEEHQENRRTSQDLAIPVVPKNRVYQRANWGYTPEATRDRFHEGDANPTDVTVL
jgi:hypothetical protein